MVDPSPIAEVLTGVFSEALWELLRRIATASLEEAPSKSAVDAAVEDGLESVIDTFEWVHEDPVLEEVCIFLAAPEVKALIQQVFAASASNHPRPRQARETFRTLWVHTFGEAHVAEGTDLWGHVIDAVGQSITSAIRQNVLEAHEAAAQRRHNVLLDHIAALQRNSDMLNRANPLLGDRVKDFVSRFIDVALLEHGTITPPSLDQEVRIPIKSLYVSPRFLRHGKTLSYDDLTAQLDRAVVRGDPGAGKSTLSSRIAFDVLEQQLGGSHPTSPRIPFVVALHPYGDAKKDRGWTLVTYIEHVVRTKYQIDPPEGVVEFLLLNGRGVVLFDGLDELQETRYRKEIRNDVEKFATIFPSTSIVVTSREVGYEQAPLENRSFPSFTIAPFDRGQVAEYVHNWYSASGLPKDEVESRTQRFLKESDRVPDLASNPLMLALMCNIHRGGELPPNRPSLYRECALMMFERWDKSRGIKRDLPYPTHLEKVLRYLAAWLFDNPAYAGGVTESELVESVGAYIVNELHDDPTEARSAAEKWVDFFQGRAWVLTAVGSTADEPLFHFAHPTFLEFFTAADLVSHFPTPNALVEHLLPYLRRAERDVVAQLAFQLQSAMVDRAADTHILLLLDEASRDDTPARQTLLSFAFRSLEFLVPSPAVLKRIVATLINEILRYSGSGATPAATSPGALLAAVFATATDNRIRLTPELCRTFVEAIVAGPPAVSHAIAKVSLYLSEVVDEHGGPGIEDAAAEAALGATHAIFEKARAPIRDLARNSLVAARQLLLLGELTPSEAARTLGPESLLAAVHLDILPGRRFASFAEELLARLRTESQRDTECMNVDSSLEGIAEVMGRSGTAFLPPLGPFAPVGVDTSGSARARPLEVSNDARFGVFALLATLTEAGVRVDDLADELGRLYDFDEWARILAARGDPDSAWNATPGWTTAQNALASRWSRGEVSFLKEPRRDRSGRTLVLYHVLDPDGQDAREYSDGWHGLRRRDYW